MRDVGAGFWRAKDSYEDCAKVQRDMRQKLAKLACAQLKERTGLNVWEFGAGVRSMRELLELDIASYIASDINPYTQQERIRLDMTDLYVGGDEFKFQQALCSLNPPKDGFDLIVSNACLQWLEPSRILPVLCDLLAPSGVLAFTSFAPANLCEVKELTGAGLKYLDVDELKVLLSRLDIKVAFSQKLSCEFKNALEVFRHLKNTGVNTLTPAKPLSKGLIELYQKRYGGRLSYEPIYIVAKKRSNLS